MYFFFNDTATTEIYTLSLHDALPICVPERAVEARTGGKNRQQRDRPADGLDAAAEFSGDRRGDRREDRKSTRLNSSHANISYAVFCLKKKKNVTPQQIIYKSITLVIT